MTEIDEEKISLTPQQEDFCIQYFLCKRNATEAYRQAYNCEGSSENTIRTNAYRLIRNTYVSHTIRKMFDQQAERLNVTTEGLTEEYEEARALAKQAGEYSPMVAAITGKAKLHGLITDKSETKNKTDISILPTREELIAEAEKRGLPTKIFNE